MCKYSFKPVSNQHQTHCYTFNSNILPFNVYLEATHAIIGHANTATNPTMPLLYRCFPIWCVTTCLFLITITRYLSYYNIILYVIHSLFVSYHSFNHCHFLTSSSFVAWNPTHLHLHPNCLFQQTHNLAKHHIPNVIHLQVIRAITLICLCFFYINDLSCLPCFIKMWTHTSMRQLVWLLVWFGCWRFVM